jgi:hypothetical protein
MIVYNSTVKVDAAIAADWLQWLQQEQAPQMLATGLFSKFQVLQLLQTEDSDGPTYAVQFYAASLGDFENYLAHHAEHFRQQTAERWGGDFIAFNTVMEVIV